MDNAKALAHADTVVDGYEIVTRAVLGGYRADVTGYPNIFALEPTEAEARAAARECLRQHLASQVERGVALKAPRQP